MFARESARGEPPWLLLNPAWKRELLRFNFHNDVDILSSLQTFGMRMRQHNGLWTEEQIFWPIDEVYYEHQPQNEEGWSTEDQVRFASPFYFHGTGRQLLTHLPFSQYFGGVLETLPSTISILFLETDTFRFLADCRFIEELIRPFLPTLTSPLPPHHCQTNSASCSDHNRINNWLAN